MIRCKASRTLAVIRSESCSCFGQQVTTESGAVGTIEGSFGKSGKFKVAFPKGIAPAAPGHNSLRMTFKRYIYDQNKRNMVQ